MGRVKRREKVLCLAMARNFTYGNEDLVRECYEWLTNNTGIA
jgi:hypothetical protein